MTLRGYWLTNAMPAMAIIVQQVVVDVGIPIEVGTSSGWMTREDFEALRTHNRTVLIYLH